MTIRTQKTPNLYKLNHRMRWTGSVALMSETRRLTAETLQEERNGETCKDKRIILKTDLGGI
jgi:hypothetical protein